jgi:hypothetical protein
MFIAAPAFFVFSGAAAMSDQRDGTRLRWQPSRGFVVAVCFLLAGGYTIVRDCVGDALLLAHVRPPAIVSNCYVGGGVGC